MKHIVFDLELTCGEEIELDQREIIEIGAVQLNEKKEVVAYFHSFAKPVKNPILTKYCKELTHIAQCEVDRAPSLAQVLYDFQVWAMGEEVVFYAWGADVPWLKQVYASH